MLILRGLAGSSFLALMAGAAVAQVTTVGTNRSEIQDNGRDNKAQVENSAEGNDRNSSLIVFSGNGNRAAVIQVGDDHAVVTRHQGDNNTSAVRQNGFRNSATLLQAGNLNGSNVDQYLDPGIGGYGDRVASVEQRGNSNSSSIVQVNGSNTATVRQGTSTEASNGGVSTIYQFSSGNTATVTMVGGSPDAANRSHIEQTRIDPILTNSNAIVNLNGSFNLSYLYQVGARNTASHSMTGTQNTIIGRSYGNGLTSSVSQAGYRNFVTVNQLAGDRNSSAIEQRDDSSLAPGGDRQVSVTQGGSDNSSTVVQRFTFNTVVVNQSGNGTQSGITQNGAGNFARANLVDGSLDAPNKSIITQQWDLVNLDSRLVADVTVRGLGNESSVSQRGIRHTASVDMAGGGVGADTGGLRRGNSVSINQDRTLANNAPTPVVGTGHTARVQIGLLNGVLGTVTSINQLGVHATIGNDVTVRQDGQFDRVSVSQSIGFVEAEGGAVANVAARGLLNQVSVSQFGRQFAIVTQGFGRESTFSSTSYGSGGRRNGIFVGPGIGNNTINASQYGDRNSVNIAQEGSFNGVTMWQKIGSSDNSASVNQGIRTFLTPEGFGQACSFGCEMARNSTAAVMQSGRHNGAEITQYSEASRATIEQNGTGSSGLRNIAAITQFNTSSAEASIIQATGVGPSSAGDPASGAAGDPNSFAGGARAAEARIRQQGSTVVGRIEQRGRGQFAFIDQSGANNLASILQDVEATNATAIITQSGSGNSYNVVQTQPGQYISVSQTGTNNAVTNVITRP